MNIHPSTSLAPRALWDWLIGAPIKPRAPECACPSAVLHVWPLERGFDWELRTWLRLPAVVLSCAEPDCSGAAVGVAMRPTGERVLACGQHRRDLKALRLGALDWALEGVPSEVARG